MSVAQATVTQNVNHPPFKPKYGWLVLSLVIGTDILDNTERNDYKRERYKCRPAIKCRTELFIPQIRQQ